MISFQFIRTGLSRYFGLTERAGRLLLLGCMERRRVVLEWPESIFFVIFLRTEQEANAIYDAGLLFLRQHLCLTQICSRPHFTWYCPMVFKLCSRVPATCRRRLLMWVAKPKMHVRHLVSECWAKNIDITIYARTHEHIATRWGVSPLVKADSQV